MQNLNELKKRIKSINDISQMTNAMQLVSAAKMRRSMVLHDSVHPFFSLCSKSMAKIISSSKSINNPFFEIEQKKIGDTWKIGYFVLSGDQGLAGAYNNNVAKFTEEHIQKKILENSRKNISTDYKLYVFGKLAREKLTRSGYKVDQEFEFPINEPTFFQARNVASIVKQKFLQHDFDLVYLIYTAMESATKMVPVVVRLAPIDKKSMDELVTRSKVELEADEENREIEYLPNADEVFSFLVDTYLNAVIYGAMVDAYSSEQTARLTAMDNATKNAEEMIKKLELISNRARQAKITTELTEIVNGAEQVNNL